MAVSERDSFIQVWRGISVFIVVMFHFNSRVPAEYIGASHVPILDNGLGLLGVCIFFVISGYLITKSIFSTKNVASFYAKRLSRIWPLFIVANIFIFAFLTIVHPPAVPAKYDFYVESRSLADLIGSIFFMRDMGFLWIDGAFWSLLVELKFYFMIGIFAVVFGESFSKIFGIFAIALFTVRLSIDVASVDGELPGYLNAFQMVLDRVFISMYLPFFALGTLLFVREKDAIFGIVLVQSCIAAAVIINQESSVSMDHNIRFSLFVVVMMIVDSYVLKSRIFDFLGKYSYSLYLFHQMIGISLIARMSPFFGFEVAMLASFLIVLGVAVGASELAEWRFRKVSERWLYRLMSLVRIDRCAFRFEERKSGNAELLGK